MPRESVPRIWLYPVGPFTPWTKLHWCMGPVPMLNVAPVTEPPPQGTALEIMIEPAMRQLGPTTGFEYDVRLDLAALSLPPEHELARAACAITGTTVGGKVSYCSEGSLFQPAGIACMVCGPGHVSQVHQPDEWIA